MAANLPVREGQRVPDVSFRIRRNGEWATITTDEIFAGKNVVVFSLPGAFTPTCSSTHLPRYNELAPAFKAQGIDAIVCISVNDPFVMEEWAQGPGSDNVLLLPDGNGEFTEKMGMLVDKSRPQLRQALVALLDARARRRSRRCSSSRRSRATRSRSPTPTRCWTTSTRRRASPTRSRSSRAKAARSAPRRSSALADAGYDYAEIPLAAHDPHEGGRRDRGRGDGAAGVHQRPPDRRHRRARGAICARPRKPAYAAARRHGRRADRSACRGDRGRPMDVMRS